MPEICIECLDDTPTRADSGRYLSSQLFSFFLGMPE